VANRTRPPSQQTRQDSSIVSFALVHDLLVLLLTLLLLLYLNTELYNTMNFGKAANSLKDDAQNAPAAYGSRRTSSSSTNGARRSKNGATTSAPPAASPLRTRHPPNQPSQLSATSPEQINAVRSTNSVRAVTFPKPTPNERTVREFEKHTESHDGEMWWTQEEYTAMRESALLPPTPHSASPNAETHPYESLAWNGTKAGLETAENFTPCNESLLTAEGAIEKWEEEYEDPPPVFDPTKYGILTDEDYEARKDRAVEFNSDGSRDDTQKDFYDGMDLWRDSKKYLKRSTYQQQAKDVFVEFYAATNSKAMRGPKVCFRAALKKNFHMHSIDEFLTLPGVKKEDLPKGEHLELLANAVKAKRAGKSVESPTAGFSSVDMVASSRGSPDATENESPDSKPAAVIGTKKPAAAIRTPSGASTVIPETPVVQPSTLDGLTPSQRAELEYRRERDRIDDENKKADREAAEKRQREQDEFTREVR